MFFGNRRKPARDANHVSQVSGMNYKAFLQAFHQKRAPQNYLEIGVHEGHTLKLADCPTIGVDPDFMCKQDIMAGKAECHLFQMTSDDFFAKRNPPAVLGAPVDTAFLDGLHWFEFLLRDFINTERHATRESVIIMHDCLPPGFIMTSRDGEAGNDPDNAVRWAWAGDVWKIVPTLQKYRPDLKIIVTDAAPTGLVLVTNLNSASRVLQANYDKILSEFREYDRGEYDRYWDQVEIHSAQQVLNDAAWEIRPVRAVRAA